MSAQPVSRRGSIIIACALVAGCTAGANERSPMPHLFAMPEVQEDFQGIVIAGPGEATFRRTKVGRSMWDRSGEDAFEYFGELDVQGIVQIHTPAGRQYDTWFRFDRRLTFVVRDLADGSIQTTSQVDGGWNLARQGVSVQMAPSPEEMVTEERFNAASESGKVVRRRFIYSIDDHLPTLYSRATTLEIHAQYLHFRSNPIRVRVNVEDD